MSVKVTTAVWTKSQSKGNERLLLLAIADNANEDDGTAYPSIETLIFKTKLAKRTVIDLVARLVKMGELAVSTKGSFKRTNLYQVLCYKFRMVQNLHHEHGADSAPSENVHGADSRKSMVQITASHIRNNRHENMKQTNNARARAGVSKNSFPLSLPTITEFTETYLDGNLESWIEQNSPAVMPQQATAHFLEFHQTANTEFKNSAAMIRAWKGWMRNAQAKAVERSERKAAIKEQGNAKTRKPDVGSDRTESRNIRNLRETVERFGLPDADLPRVIGSDGVRARAREIAAAKRVASNGRQRHGDSG